MILVASYCPEYNTIERGLETTESSIQEVSSRSDPRRKISILLKDDQGDTHELSQQNIMSICKGTFRSKIIDMKVKNHQ
jgi:hypothetical protein